MPDSKDPDEYINKHGPERVSAGCWTVREPHDIQTGQGARSTTWRSVEDKAAYLKEAVQILASLPSPMEREIYVSRLAQQTEVTADVVKLKFRV